MLMPTLCRAMISHWLYRSAALPLLSMSAGPKSAFLLAESSHGTLLKKASISFWPEISMQYKMLSSQYLWFKIYRKHSYFTSCAELLRRKQGCKRNYVDTEHIPPVAKQVLCTSLKYKPKFVFSSRESTKGTFYSFQIYLGSQMFTEVKLQQFCDASA